MTIEFRESPLEIITEIAQHIDYQGLLALRKVCKFTKNIVDKVCKITAIRQMYFADGQYLEVTVPKEEVAEMLQYVHSTIQHCVIDHFEFNSPDELCVSLIESFFLGVAVEEGCFAGLAYSTWQFALGAIKRLGLDFTKIGAHRSLEDQLHISDAVDRLILKRDHWERVIDPVGLVLAIFSRRCSHLELESVYLTEDEINQLARKLPSLDKKIYFYAKVSQGVTKRMFLSGPLNVDVKIEQLTGIVEMWYDGMRKQHL